MRIHIFFLFLLHAISDLLICGDGESEVFFSLPSQKKKKKKKELMW